MKDYAIIVAAGSGSRMHSAIPKQFMELDGKPVLMHTIEKFHTYDPQIEIIVVLNHDYIRLWKELVSAKNFSIQHKVVAGGAERFFSVKNAIDTIKETSGIVAIHDAVRPLVSLRTIETCFNTARTQCNAVPVIHINDSLRQISLNANTIVNRDNFRIVQTPQCFELSILKKAFEQTFSASFTDDASVVEASGERIVLVEGNRENIKITTPEDFRMAEALLSK